MELGQDFTAKIESVAYPGRAIARVDGVVVFVDGLLPGEVARLKVTRVKPSYAEAAIVGLDSPSPDRLPAAADPATFVHAPGCVYDHVSHDAEVRIKQSQLESFLSRIPCGTPRFDPPFASPLPEHYRNKIVLHAAWGEKGDPAPEGLRRGNRSLRLGYVRDDGVDGVTDIPQCRLARGPINERLRALREKPATLARLRPGQTVTLRWTAADGVLWWIDSPGNLPPVTEQSPIGPMQVPADGFYQMNPEVATELVKHVRDTFVSRGGVGKQLVDLYCGVGVFGLACAKTGGANLWGVESYAPGTRAARLNAKTHGIAANFESADVGRWIRSRAADALDWDDATVIVDPPRAGLAQDIAEAIWRRKPARICYVSCEPSTLSRDLTRLASAGYRAVSARLFDMFPRTAHFESFVWLER